jgi:hypothetical protein
MSRLVKKKENLRKGKMKMGENRMVRVRKKEEKMED